MSEPDPRIVRILEEIFERRDRGETPDPSSYVESSPELRDGLLRALELERQFTPTGTLGPGSRVGPFTIRELIGRGGMAAVFRAHDEDLGRDIALKVVTEDPLRPAHTILRFAREAAAIGKLRHPHIVSVHSVGRAGAFHYIAMDLIAGGTLATRIGTARTEGGSLLQVEQVVSWFLATAGALAFAHAEGVIHRDVKPGNILIEEGGHAYLSDFGLAIQPEDPVLTDSPDRVGTVSYTAPELIQGRSRNADPRSDIFSLGVTIYEAVTLRRPFSGGTAHEIQAAIVRGRPESPRSLRLDLPRDLETIITKCLETDPARRYPDAAALAEDVRRFRAYRPILARRPRLPRRIGLWARRRPALATASILLPAVISAALISALASLNERRLALEREERLAERAWLEGDRRLARSHYERVIALDPSREMARERIRRMRGEDALDRAFLALHWARRPTDPESFLFDPEAARKALDESAAELGEGSLVSVLRGLLEFVFLGDAGRARAIVDGALARDPTRALLRLRTLIETRDPRRAARDPEALAAPVRTPDEAFQDGVVLIFLDQPLAAMARFQEVLHARPDDFWSLSYLLHIHRNREDHQSALAVATHCVDLKGHLAQVYEWRALAAMPAGRLDLAERDIERFGALTSHPAQYATLRISFLASAGRSEEARALAEEALLRFPGSLTVHLSAARAFLNAGDSDRALEISEDAISVHPGPEPLAAKAAALQLRQEYGRAREIWSAIVARQTLALEARFGLAQCLVHEGDLKGALREFDRILEISPRHRRTLLDRGYARAQMGSLSAAATDFRFAADLDPGDDLARSLLAAVSAALADSGSPESYAQAAEALRLVSYRNQHLPILKVARRIRDATLRKAVQDDGWDHPLFLLVRVLELHDEGSDTSLAAAYATAAEAAVAEDREDDGTVLRRCTEFHLGQAAERLGRKNEAIRHFEAVLSTDPAHREAAEAIRRLREGP